VVRCFQNPDVVNVLDKLDPQEAADIIETELLLSDLQQAQKLVEKLQGPARSGEKKAKERLSMMEKVVKEFEAGKSARTQGLPAEAIQEFGFLTGKPLLYVANTDENGPDPALLEPLKKRAEREGADVTVLCAKLESEIVQLPEEERKVYYETAGIASPGLAELARAGKRLLKLICFFTAGPEETRAWLIPEGTRAVKAAGKIHSDIERGFIRAERYAYDDIVRLGSYKAVQEKGLVSMEGKEYEMRDGDVVYFRFNV
jgi:ribosome-binding ATPase